MRAEIRNSSEPDYIKYFRSAAEILINSSLDQERVINQLIEDKEFYRRELGQLRDSLKQSCNCPDHMRDHN